MKMVRYTLMPDIAGSFLEKEVPLSSFVREIHWVFIHKHIPPLGILNEALAKGESPREAEWEPFQISYTEYEELVNDLFSNPNDGYKQYKVPAYVESFSQWRSWLQSIGY